MTAYEKIIAYFEDNKETFYECLEELDGLNGFLGDDRIYYMDELNELYCGDIEEALRRAYYGHDGETWSYTRTGEKEYGAFCPNREFFGFNGYGNLVSYDTKDNYMDFLYTETIEEMQERRSDIWTINHTEELAKLFDEAEKENEQEADA